MGQDLELLKQPRCSVTLVEIVEEKQIFWPPRQNLNRILSIWGECHVTASRLRDARDVSAASREGSRGSPLNKTGFKIIGRDSTARNGGEQHRIPSIKHVE